MGDLAVRAENISKEYTIGALRQRYQSVTDHIVHAVKSLLSCASRPDPGSNTIWALKDVSFEIRKGEAVGIIGRNGSGKSTLLRILSRITEPTHGRALVCGRLCSLLEVGTGFHPELTGRDNIYLSGTILGMKKAEIDRRFDEIVAFAEIEKFIDTPVKHYSSGMYVRLGFAVAAHMEPEILIVDEALAVGDGNFQAKCMNKMQDVERHGQTILFVSHNMSAVTRICHRAILLEGGCVLKDGPSREVVGEYLSSGHRQGSYEWPDSRTAPGNDIVRMCAVRVRTEAGEVTNTVDIRQPIGVEIEYDVLERGHLLLAAFGLHNEEDVEVFFVVDCDPAWRRRPRPLGRFVSTAWIPGNFLSEGTFFVVEVHLLTEVPHRIHCKAPEALAFHVVERGNGESVRGGLTGHWTGVVRPLLKWTTNHSPSENVNREKSCT